MGKHAKPTNTHPLLPKLYKGKDYELVTGKETKYYIFYMPLPFGLGLVRYPIGWTDWFKGCYGRTGLSIRSRFWALYDWADHATFDDRGEYILSNIRQRQNGSVRIKK